MLEEQLLETRAEQLKGRVNRCRCKYCGGKLELRRIIFSDYENSRVEIFCSKCDRIEYGIEPEIYRCAQYFVEEMGFTCYPDLDDNAYTRKMTIAKVCEILTWGIGQLGFLQDNGFVFKPRMDTTVLGDCLLVTDSALQDLLDKGDGS